MGDGVVDRLMDRLARLREAMASAGVVAYFTDDLLDIRWISGFTGSHAAVLVTATEAVLATDSRYEQQAADESPMMDLVIGRHVVTMMGQRVAASSGHVHVSAAQTSVAVMRALEVSGARVSAEDSLIAPLRVVKDAGEMRALRDACSISDAALRQVLEQSVSGRTERDIAVHLERTMVDLGAEAPAFATIVASGPNSAIPHHRPTDRVVALGDLLKIDFGARVEGYHADMTRTFVIGEPAAWQREIHDLVRAAQQAGVDAVRAGAGASDVDLAARTVIEEAGYGQHFGHGLGHGVGLAIHEEPFLGATAAATLSAGSPITIEPGIYLPGRGGVRIEDTVVVEEHGVQTLTLYPRELISLG